MQRGVLSLSNTIRTVSVTGKHITMTAILSSQVRTCDVTKLCNAQPNCMRHSIYLSYEHNFDRKKFITKTIIFILHSAKLQNFMYIVEKFEAVICL